MVRIYRLKNAAVLVAASFIMLCFGESLACSRSLPFSFDELFVADAIVVATATKYVGEPDLKTRTNAVPKELVEFRVDEILKGKIADLTIRLNGYLGSSDDYNELPVPYNFVRKNGRSGACIANTYKRDGMFLLFLKKTKDGYTTNISALGPSNEQIAGNDDAWLKWVRTELERRNKK